MSSDTKRTTEKRVPLFAYIRPSIRTQIDIQRAKLGQTRSVWLERAAIAWLKSSKGEK